MTLYIDVNITVILLFVFKLNHFPPNELLNDLFLNLFGCWPFSPCATFSFKPVLNFVITRIVLPPAPVHSRTSLPARPLIGPFQSSRATWTGRERLQGVNGPSSAVRFSSCRSLVTSRSFDEYGALMTL